MAILNFSNFERPYWFVGFWTYQIIEEYEDDDFDYADNIDFNDINFDSDFTIDEYKD